MAPFLLLLSLSFFSLLPRLTYMKLDVEGSRVRSDEGLALCIPPQRTEITRRFNAHPQN